MGKRNNRDVSRHTVGCKGEVKYNYVAFSHTPECSLLSGECYLGMFRSLFMLPLCMKSKEEGTEIVTPGEFYITAFLHKHSLPSLCR